MPRSDGPDGDIFETNPYLKNPSFFQCNCGNDSKHLSRTEYRGIIDYLCLHTSYLAPVLQDCFFTTSFDQNVLNLILNYVTSARTEPTVRNIVDEMKNECNRSLEALTKHSIQFQSDRALCDAESRLLQGLLKSSALTAEDINMYKAQQSVCKQRLSQVIQDEQKNKQAIMMEEKKKEKVVVWMIVVRRDLAQHTRTFNTPIFLPDEITR